MNLVLSISLGYAVHALHYIASRDDRHPVLAREIADKFKMPYDSTLKILRQLAQAGLVTPHRGCRGGFTLVREAEAISLLDVVEAVDGPVEHGMEMPDGSGDRNLCTRTDNLFHEAALELRKKLQAFTLADLVAANDRIDLTKG
ncbi:MAG: RrF2 family transcriptional regulator [Candidatus Zixiibacteriota bacterium]